MASVPTEKGETMYKSPIDLFVTDIMTQIEKQTDDEIYKAVASVGINVDKDELIRALRYDRQQYEKGYMDGQAAAKPEWIPVSERLPENRADVLVVAFWHEKWNVLLGWYAPNGGVWHVGPLEQTGYPVSHWMPLPQQPKGE
jgi:hypothetical protein